MKKILFIMLLFVCFQSYGQSNRFPSVDSAKNYVLKYIRNSTLEAFTNLRMQNTVYGTLELLDSLTATARGVDSIWISNDSLKYRLGPTTYLAGIIAGSGSADSSVFATQYRLDTTRNGIRSDLNGKQPTLVSGTNIKTINGSSLLGSGNLTVTGGNDSSYIRIELLPDSTGAEFVRDNDGRDTLFFNGSTSGGGGGGTWGSITGTLSDQTDLQTALNLKLNISDTAAMLTNYPRRQELIDTAAAIRNDFPINNTDSAAAVIRRGTYAQRIALTPDTGQIFWQTDRLAGQWEYDGVRWSFKGAPDKYDFNENFTAGSTPIISRLSGLTGGTGAQANIYRQRGKGSYLQLNSGTTTTGYSSYQIAVSEETTIELDSIITYREFLVQLPTLSDGTDHYHAAVGWLGHQSLWGFMSLGFFYSHDNNSGKWETRTRKFDNSGNMTNKDTGIPVVAGQIYKMAIEINGYTNTIYFYIDDVLVATHTSSDNIPIPNSTVGSQYNYGIAKQAGTNARLMNVYHASSYIVKQNNY